MLNAFKDGTVPVGSEKKKENPELIERGIFVDKQLPEYCEAYNQMVERIRPDSQPQLDFHE
jgi:2-oxoglutarate ferredoxin oxidoreductase subunit beta